MMNKPQQYQKFADARRKEIANPSVLTKVKPKKEGKVWVLEDRGRLLKNKNKKALFRDLATIRGYKNVKPTRSKV